MTCQQVVELVTAYLDGALDAATSARFEAHLANCDGCAAYLDQFRFTIATVGTISDNQLDPVFRARLMETFEETAGSW